MDSVDNRLKAIGFRAERGAAECWRIERAAAARRRPATPRRDPARSRALSVWLDRLGDRRSSLAYRIRRIAERD